MVGEGRIDGLEFHWGKKKGRGGKKKDIQFYESFNYDGTEYALYDSVYLYKEGESEPYIGKIVKVWEQADKVKKVKILWFFRPCEILNYLGAEGPLENELFLASGDGAGLANINPLEVIAGKCNVVCTSKDIRNRQPTNEELHMADFVFYRTFDVGKCIILDKIDEKIAGLDAKLMLNSVEPLKAIDVLKLDSEMGFDGKVLASNDTVLLSNEKVSTKNKTLNIDENSNDTSTKENKDTTYQLGKQKSSPGENPQFDAIAESNNLPDTNNEDEIILDENTTSKCQVDPDGNAVKGSKVPVSQLDIERKVKHSDERDIRPLKKVKLEETKNIQKLNIDFDANDLSPKVPIVPTLEDNSKDKRVRDSHGSEEGPSKRLKPMKKVKELSNGKVLASSSKEALEEDKIDGCLLVTRRPDADRSKWFRGLPWEERMKSADEQGTLVLLQNLDPAYASAEVEDIIWHGFKESSTAHMIQRTACSSPHNSQALVIFKTKEAAETVVRKLDAGCFMLPNGRCLVGSFATPCTQGKGTFFGHLVIDKLKLQMQREMKQAVSTSHCSQPNTIEYDMAMEWCLLQERSDRSWKNLFKLHGQELRKLKAELKSNFYRFTRLLEHAWTFDVPSFLTNVTEVAETSGFVLRKQIVSEFFVFKPKHPKTEVLVTVVIAIKVHSNMY